MSTTSTVSTSADTAQAGTEGTTAPILLVAHAPTDATEVDRCLVSPEFVVGRDANADFPIRDVKLSKRHFTLTRTAGPTFIQDLGSTNGTYVDGQPLVGRMCLANGDVIRAGRCVLVFHADGQRFLEAAPTDRHGIAGRFHAAGLVAALETAGRSGRPVLLIGPPGAGKALAATALRELSGAPSPALPLAADHDAGLPVVRIPSLAERVADIPALFDYMLVAALARRGLVADDALSRIGAEHYEALCLDGFEGDNVRGLIDLAGQLAARLADGVEPARAVAGVFATRFAQSPVVQRRAQPSEAATFEETVPLGPPPQETAAHYEHHRELITAVYRAREGGLSATERALKNQGVSCSRRWLATFLSKWGARV